MNTNADQAPPVTPGLKVDKDFRAAFELASAGNVVSLRSIRHGETFHPGVGPAVEAAVVHVAQQRLVERAGAGPLVVWDVGLGGAANALAIIEHAKTHGIALEVVSFEEDFQALEFAAANAAVLGYPCGREAWFSLVMAGGCVASGSARWRCVAGDFRVRLSDMDVPSPHAILFDPYSPRANPGMWALETFRGMRERADTRQGCILTCYSRSTAVRTTMLLAGWFVGRGCATGEKIETTVAATHPSLLDSPLDSEWLGRVARSTAPGPLTRDDTRLDVSAVLAHLRAHPQFG